VKIRAGGRQRRGGGRRLRNVVLVGIVLAGLFLHDAARSAFFGRAASTGNQLAAGSIVLTENSAGQTMFTVTGLRPGVAPSRCIRVTYEGTLNSTIKTYGTVTGGSGLDNYLMISMTRGSGVTGTFPDCTGFTPDATDYNLLGPGVMFSGTLATLPTTRATGLTDPKLNWSTNESHWYQFTVDVLDNPAALGQTATASFFWDAR
jgi:hypothetical protein